MNKACLFKGAVNNIYSAFHITLLIRILNTQDKISIFMLCHQKSIQRRTQIAYMHASGRAGRKTGSYFCHFLFLHTEKLSIKRPLSFSIVNIYCKSIAAR